MATTEPYWAQSKSVEWYTPKIIFDDLKVEFDMDVCSPGADKCHTPAKKHIVLPEDGLIANWNGFVWMNPPFGRNNYNWYNKFANHNNGIALMPTNVLSTKKFAAILPKIDAVLVILGRINFINGENQKLGSNTTGTMLIASGLKAKTILSDSKLGQVWYPLVKVSRV